ncbi:phosphoenolpyruvate--protein phosphotransferase [Ornithinimicrobium humiphilum]|uniref:Phosphocarrier protein HPr n=1 Tax=Ornithinimicrobium humiphilum TaxID=125288 RepID=A0A543KPY5_9MICO|nr:phosphoenolpyruvate--protein phosphotransferase [Ornithinimicrobium humiphilum]TQM97143.1 phosphocarrier protein HPr /phosphoenolpyruvate--protein phosphotransferase /dihydroxyacetone kinase DhaM subunit [Ornithinimicrobium humiphilum]
MISLVVVAHSRPLARAAVALAAQMVAGPDAPHVGVAAGLDEETTGTDAAAVAEALRVAHAASGGAGVLVLLDLGSAVLSTEMALELVDPEVAEAVRVTSAPLVEGLVSAVVTAAAGGDLDAVEREARRALLPKAVHLGDERTADPPEQHVGPAGEALTAELPVVGEHGLHARPAARLVARVAELAPRTTVRVRNLTSGRGPVDARSVSAVATLDARRGHVLQAEARGPEAETVLEALTDLAARAFGDLPGPAEPLADVVLPAPTVSAEPGVAGSGLEAAVGPAVLVDVLPDPHGIEAEDTATELARLEEAVQAALAQFAELSEQAGRDLGEEEAELFLAQSILLRDPRITTRAHELVAGGASAAAAWSDAVTETATAFEQLPDPYQRERAQDIRGIGERVLRLLLGLEQPRVVEEGVLVVDELDAAVAISVDASRVHGIVTRAGGDTGHGVLIAASRGIPVLTGVGERADVEPGTLLAFDVRSGELAVDPSPPVRSAFEEMVATRRAEREAALHNAHLPAVTTDHVRIRVKANVSSVAVARLGAGLGADGSGLIRTEAVFAQWRQAPTTDQQVEVYRAIADVYHPHPVTIRTWDAGGDKPLAFVPREAATANPFLGARGLRAFADDPTLVLEQLEAICRVAVDRRIRVLFPMITTAADVATARELLDRAARRAGLGRPPEHLEVGIMIEVPAAALRVRQLATGLDFVSIGSNDLVQYVLAAERGNPAVAPWSDRLEPAVLELIRHVADGAPDGVDVSLCGAMAADPDLAGLLVGLGVTELSTSAATVPMVKQRLRAGSTAEFRALADRALAAADAGEVRALLERAGRRATA